MGIIGDGGEAVRKFFGVRIPIADSAKPSGVNVEHLELQIGRIFNHAISQSFVDGHAAAPAVVHEKRIAGIVPSGRIRENFAHPTAQHVARAIRATAKASEKNLWRDERSIRGQPRAKRSWRRIQSGSAVKRMHFSGDCNSDAAAEFDSHVPAVLRGIYALHQEPRNDFAGFALGGVRVGAGIPFPTVAFFHRDIVCADRRRSVRALFHKEVLDRRATVDGEIELKAVLKRQPDFLVAEVFKAELVFDRAEVCASLPLPR